MQVRRSMSHYSGLNDQEPILGEYGCFDRKSGGKSPPTGGKKPYARVLYGRQGKVSAHEHRLIGDTKKVSSFTPVPRQ